MSSLRTSGPDSLSSKKLNNSIIGPVPMGSVSTWLWSRNWTQSMLSDAEPASLQGVRSFEIQLSVGPQALGPKLNAGAAFWTQRPASLQNVRSSEIQVSVGHQALGPELNAGAAFGRRACVPTGTAIAPRTPGTSRQTFSSHPLSTSSDENPLPWLSPPPQPPLPSHPPLEQAS